MEILLLIAVCVAFLFLFFRAGESSSPSTTTSAPVESVDANAVFTVFRVAQKNIRRGENNDGLPAKEIRAIGMFPVRQPTRLGICVSVLDRTSGKSEPVRCPIEEFQEPDTTAYHVRTDIGFFSPGQSFAEWTPVGVVIPEILHPPYSGKRRMKMVVRLIDLSNPPPIRLGFLDARKHPGVLKRYELAFTHHYVGRGYREAEAEEHRDETKSLSLKMAVAVAMSDGSLHKKEGMLIKNWTERALKPFSGERREFLKNLCNNALKKSYVDAKSGSLAIDALAQRLNKIGDTKSKYGALELCTDIMAADGVADPNELKALHKIAKILELDAKKVEEIRDRRIIKLNTSVSSPAGIEEILGIESDWDADRVKNHLRAEFRKWNGRLNTLAEGEGRDNAQRMLDLIAEARKKYV